MPSASPIKCVGQPGEIDEAVPVGVVASEARHLEPKNKPDAGECDLGGEARKPERATAPEPERPRSSSMTTMRSSGQPSSRALVASAYCRSVDSRLCSTCAGLD